VKPLPLNLRPTDPRHDETAPTAEAVGAVMILLLRERMLSQVLILQAAEKVEGEAAFVVDELALIDVASDSSKETDHLQAWVCLRHSSASG